MDIADPEVVHNGTTNAPQETPQLGSDRYRVLSTLGAGGMGVVYLAEDLKLHRQVAIKKLREDVATQNARERIQQEARLLAQLNHPNIVALHDVLEDTAGSDTSVALVMEYIEGTTLRAWMRERSPSLQQKLSLLMQICLGLQQAHDLGIIHRDLKADNILIAENAKGEPVAKITDFGIAKSQQLDEKTLTAENQLAGTITAMSPEQILGKTLTARSDLFSLGAIAFELLCGSRPFEKHEAGALAMANRITSEPHIPPQQAWAGIPEPLAILLDKLLAKEPAQRPESAQIVYQGFALLHKQGMEAEAEDFTATLTDLFTQQKVKSRRRWQRVVAGIAATLVLGAGSYWGWKEITRLEPQYIAVMPVEINGEIRGEENAKALTQTMVRQALMNSTSQLKASALVSFSNTKGLNFEAQLRKLRNKGVTDVLYAQLDCAQVRCKLELQRIDPKSELISNQSSFVFLTNKQQEAQYRATNLATTLFEPKYQQGEISQASMSDEDYNLYLDILSRLDEKNLTESDQNILSNLATRYPLNPYIYEGLTDVAGRLFVLKGNKGNLNTALRILDQGEDLGAPETTIYRLKLFLLGLGEHSEQYERLITKLEAADFPIAELLHERARQHFRTGNNQLSLQYSLDAASLNPSADNLYLVGLNNAVIGNYTQAHKSFTNLIKVYPKHWSSYSALANIEMENGQLLAAETSIQKIPDHLRGWRTRLNLGVIYYLQGHHQNALKEFTGVLEQVPNDVSTKVLIAETYQTLGQEKKALKEFQDAEKLTETATGLRDRRYRALALAHLQKNSEAIELILKILNEAPNDVDTKYFSAQIYALSNEWQSANYYLTNLIEQGMSAEWFNIPVFKQLCTQPKVSEKVKATLCG